MKYMPPPGVLEAHRLVLRALACHIQSISVVRTPLTACLVALDLQCRQEIASVDRRCGTRRGHPRF